MRKQDALDMLRDAQDQLAEAIQTLKAANRILKDRHAEAYIIDHLETLTSSNHRFMSRDYNVEQWIADLESGAMDDEPEEDAA